MMNDEEQQPLLLPLVHNNNDDSNTQKPSWGRRSILIVVVLALVGTLSLIGNNFMRSSPSPTETFSKRLQLAKSKVKTTSQLAVIAKHLEMAKNREISYASLDEDEQVTLFEEFQLQFGRKYLDIDEESVKFQNFQAFMQVCDKGNEKSAKSGIPDAARHGITQFADLSEQEFTDIYLTGLRKPGYMIDTEEGKVIHEEDLAALISRAKSSSKLSSSKSNNHRQLNGKKDAPSLTSGPTLSEAMAAQKALESKKIALPLPPSDAEVSEAAGNCPSTCYGTTCDYWVSAGYTCDTMTNTYKCDCSGCSCGAKVPTAAPVKTSGRIRSLNQQERERKST